MTDLLPLDYDAKNSPMDSSVYFGQQMAAWLAPLDPKEPTMPRVPIKDTLLWPIIRDGEQGVIGYEATKDGILAINVHIKSALSVWAMTRWRQYHGDRPLPSWCKYTVKQILNYTIADDPNLEKDPEWSPDASWKIQSGDLLIINGMYFPNYLYAQEHIHMIMQSRMALGKATLLLCPDITRIFNVPVDKKDPAFEEFIESDMVTTLGIPGVLPQAGLRYAHSVQPPKRKK